MSSITFFRTLFFTALGVSLYLFLKEGLNSGISWPHFDKVAHFIVFLGLSLLFDLSFNRSKPIALAFALGYGVAVEVLQMSFTTRQGSIGDVIADIAGSVSYYVFFQTWVRDLVSKLIPIKPI